MICIGRMIGGDGGKAYFSGSCLGLVNSSSLSLTVKDKYKQVSYKQNVSTAVMLLQQDLGAIL